MSLLSTIEPRHHESLLSLSCPGRIKQPRKRTRAEAKVAFGLRVRGASEARRVVHGIGSRGLQGFLFTDVRWLGGSAIASKCCEPHALLAGTVIDDVVGARRTVQGPDGSLGSIINVYPDRDSLAGADDGYLPPTHLLSHITVGHEPLVASNFRTRAMPQADILAAPKATRIIVLLVEELSFNRPVTVKEARFLR